jgi:hypothetical protein
MLITKEIEMNKKMTSIENLPKNSHKMVDVKCDNCGKEKKVKYQSYNISTNSNTEKFYCSNKECINKKRKIALQKKYGVDNVFQLEEVKNKIKITNLDLYGVENPHQNEEIKNKAENTNLERYGVKNPFQSEEIKLKIRKSNFKNYGFDYPSQNEDFFQKN